jgi:hypothetical protein
MTAVVIDTDVVSYLFKSHPLAKCIVSLIESRIPGNRSLTVAAPIRAARVSKRFPIRW